MGRGLEASFIVPTHGRAEVLSLSVPLFLGQDYPRDAFEVIVVSDGPDPAAQTVIDRLAAPGLRFAALEENRGPGAARNRAIAMARGRILVFVDDDSLVAPDFLRRHLRHHEGRDDRVVTGPIIDVTEPPDMTAPPRPAPWALHLNPFPGGNASIARARVEAVGGFDEAFRHYGWEDPELYARLRQAGRLSRRFERRAPIWHFKPQGAATSFAARVRRELQRGGNGAMFYARHPRLEVGLQTKQLAPFHLLDRALDAMFGLERRLQAALERGEAPASRLLRAMVLLHAEISAGRRRID
ncbi:Glycosyltransferase, GT2 family [Meinhardsimonia xiamenensis]|jgi:glycosyltransferase involved in cell wall biosynthesis|uniref:Glycosyltransferase, GT2 family n=1 Tax=Meinhardsimonia xiamenensis TaxID=990712 RepID=A0A1G9FMI8_9RHOB|nr:glycosyltransferase [Meinhardsimonia xiamenensis]PRX37771.1 GT2 family glycosyltransferase [Meinhardsimonia xiamenensis]SDK89565.1 Glycosyltransferase, GT2 family [Meinhardsimonia xiamenensis]